MEAGKFSLSFSKKIDKKVLQKSALSASSKDGIQIEKPFKHNIDTFDKNTKL